MDEACSGTRGEDESEASENSASFSSRLTSWLPRPLAFRPYNSPIRDTNAKPPLLKVIVRKPLVARLTKDIVEIYQICNPQFHYSSESNLKRFLTSPSTGLLNDGYDNANSDLILTPNYFLVNTETKRRYVVKDVLGHGTFGQVAKCWVAESNSFVAVKIIKNLPAYYQQALVEVSILTTLNKKFDPEDKHHIVRIYDYFVHQRHLCISFELLDTNLYELIKYNHFRGLALSIVQLFSKQILRGLALMKVAGIIHCDLKPENILLCASVKPAAVKIIDFGSACMEDRTVYSYIQSRYYRSPEVLLGYQYTTAIDMWSFGCIVAELFLGLPLFPGASEFDLLRRMIKILGGQPPDYILRKAKNTNKFFKFVGSISHEEKDYNQKNNCSMYQVLTEEEYGARESQKPSMGKEYFNHMNLETIVSKYPCRKDLAEEDIIKESQIRLALIDFLRGLIEFDPAKRWSPLQASKHPFVTGEPFTCPYRPAPETPYMPVSQNIKVDHNPAGGHWFAAGLSPNISGRNRAVMPNNSPRYQLMSYVHPGSYGSLGSHGSYNEGLGLGSSYGSYGENSNNFHAFYSPAGPSGMNIYAQSGISILGNSPDTRRRPHGNGLGIGFSPGNFAPMSLGLSPSQFTPPNSSYSQITAASGSPVVGHYGPLSPVRGGNSCHGSPLGKMASGSQYNNRRKNWGPPFHGNFQSQETDVNSCCQPEGNNKSCVFIGSPSHHGQPPNSTWRPPQGGRSVSSSSSVSHMQTVHGGGYDKSEATNNSLPDPGDWDPNYSEELLLQEDNSDMNSMSSEFINGMNLTESLTSEPLIGSGRSSRITNTTRHNVPHVQSSLGGSSNPVIYGYASAQMTTNNSSYFTPNLAQRLGQQQQQQQQQQQVQWHNNSNNHHIGRSAPFRDGRRGSYSVSNAPPASHGRKDYARNG